MEKKQDKKVMVVGLTDVVYQICFLSMAKLKMKEITLFKLPELDEKRIRELQYARSFYPFGSLKIGDEKDFGHTDILIIAANEKQLEGEQENDYFRKNVQLVRKVINQAMANGFSGLILVVAEPTDLLTYLIWKFSGLPKRNIFGIGTFADSTYFQYELSQKLSLSYRDVKGYVVGGSQKEQKTLAWSRSYAGATPILSLTMNEKASFSQDDMLEIEQKVLDRSAFIDSYDASFTYASAAIKLLQFILTNEEALVPLSHVADFNDLKNVPLSLPVLLGNEGIRISSGLEFSDMEKKELEKIAKEIRQRLDWVENG